MTLETESIDKLFLELSQFTQATTAKELKYKQQRDELLEGLRDAKENYTSDCRCPKCRDKRNSYNALIAKIEGDL